MKESVEEMLIKFIQNKLNTLLKAYDKEGDPEICDDVCQALELCDKLLTNDYFYESEKIVDSFVENTKTIPHKYNNWSSQYVIDLKEKKKDLKKLFDIIVENIEDWC